MKLYEANPQMQRSHFEKLKPLLRQPHLHPSEIFRLQVKTFPRVNKKQHVTYGKDSKPPFDLFLQI